MNARKFFTDEEWSIMRDAVEQEAVLQPEEEWEKYGIIIDKINALLKYEENGSSSDFEWE